MKKEHRNGMVWLACLPIYFYQRFVSKMLHAVIPGSGCRFHPSCSDYGLIALKRFGFWRGTWLTLKRIGRCQPWGGSGVDEVPSE